MKILSCLCTLSSFLLHPCLIISHRVFWCSTLGGLFVGYVRSISFTTIGFRFLGINSRRTRLRIYLLLFRVCGDPDRFPSSDGSNHERLRSRKVSLQGGIIVRFSLASRMIVNIRLQVYVNILTYPSVSKLTTAQGARSILSRNLCSTLSSSSSSCIMPSVRSVSKEASRRFRDGRLPI
jgi:hypothetical protein